MIDFKELDSFSGNSTSPLLTEERACPVCASTSAKALFALSNFQFYSDCAQLPKRTYIKDCQCLHCYAIYLNPAYSDYGLEVLFKEAGMSYGSSDGRADEEIGWLFEKGLLNSGTTVMDVGCYEGAFLAKLPDGVFGIGIDIDEPAIERGRSNYAGRDISFIHGDFESFECEERPGVITMFHVLEHLSRPVEVLKKLRSLADNRTRLLVEVPILELGATNDINGFFSVQHMTHFSRQSLANTLARAGWKIIDRFEAPDYNGCRVLAAPASVEEDVSGDPNDLFLVYSYFSKWYEELGKVEERLMRYKELGEKFIIRGGGAHTEFLYHMTSILHSRKRSYAIVDNDPMKSGTTWRGITIYNSEALSDVDWSDTYMIISSYGSQEKIYEQAVSDHAVPKDRIIRLYDSLRVY